MPRRCGPRPDGQRQYERLASGGASLSFAPSPGAAVPPTGMTRMFGRQAAGAKALKPADSSEFEQGGRCGARSSDLSGKRLKAGAQEQTLSAHAVRTHLDSFSGQRCRSARLLSAPLRRPGRSPAGQAEGSKGASALVFRGQEPCCGCAQSPSAPLRRRQCPPPREGRAGAAAAAEAGARSGACRRHLVRRLGSEGGLFREPGRDRPGSRICR